MDLKSGLAGDMRPLALARLRPSWYANEVTILTSLSNNVNWSFLPYFPTFYFPTFLETSQSHFGSRIQIHIRSY